MEELSPTIKKNHKSKRKEKKVWRNACIHIHHPSKCREVLAHKFPYLAYEAFEESFDYAIQEFKKLSGESQVHENKIVVWINPKVAKYLNIGDSIGDPGLFLDEGDYHLGYNYMEKAVLSGTREDNRQEIFWNKGYGLDGSDIKIFDKSFEIFFGGITLFFHGVFLSNKFTPIGYYTK